MPHVTGIERRLESNEPEDAGSSAEIPGAEPVWGGAGDYASEVDSMDEQCDKLELYKCQYGGEQMAACAAICQWMVYS